MPILTTIPQCHHIKDNGIRCGSPALRGKDLCYFHLRQARRPAPYIPPLKDRASIHVVLTEIMRAAFAGRIEDDRLRTMLYALQIAISNLPHREFGVARPGRVAQPSSAAFGILTAPDATAPGQRPGATQAQAPGRGRPGYTGAGESPASTEKEDLH